MRKYIEVFILLAFLGYGLIRLGVGSSCSGRKSGYSTFRFFMYL